MRNRSIAAALAAAMLMLGAGSALAAEEKAAVPAQGKASASEKASAQGKSAHATKRGAAATPKPVDINKAGSQELKKLLGVSDAEAAKIIAGRPYASKAELVTRKVVDADVYERIRQSIVARQPYKSAAKNAAIYAKRK